MDTLEIIGKGKPEKKPKAFVSEESKKTGKREEIHRTKNAVSHLGMSAFQRKFAQKKICDLCKKHGGANATHNTGDCKKYDKGGTLKAGFKPKGKSNRN